MISWPATAIGLLILAAFIATGYMTLGAPTGVWIGASAYLAYSLVSRSILARSHRRGMRLLSDGQYVQAMDRFRESLEFFSNHPWIDNFRAVVFLSPSAMTYREMAMCNLAFCHSQIGQGEQAKAMYQAVLNDYPENRFAPVALNMIESGQRLSGSRNKQP